MLEKESKFVLKQSVYFMGLVLLAPLLLLLVTFSFGGKTLLFKEALFGLWHFGLLIFSVFMGISTFSNDIKSGGMEYLLTLPYTRLQLLRYKVLPRLSALMIVLALYAMLFGAIGLNLAAMTTIPVLKTSTLVYFCISLYVTGLTFSVYRGSMVLSALASIAVFTLVLTVVHLIPALVQVVDTGYVVISFNILDGFFRAPAYMYFMALGILGTFITAFLYAFKTFDLKPSKNFIKRHLKVFVPITVVIISISFGWVYSSLAPPWKTYFLTSSNRLIEEDADTVQLYDRDNFTKLERLHFYTHFVVERDNIIYTQAHSPLRKNDQLIRMNLDTNQSDVLYTPPPENNLGFRVYLYKKSLAFFEEEPSGQKLLTILPDATEKVKKIPVQSLMKKRSINPIIFGAGVTGGQHFWLQYTGYERKWSITKIYENGQIMYLGKTDVKPLYLNNLMITGNKGTLTFSKITDDGIETVKELNVPRGLQLFTRFSTDLEQLPTTECYGRLRYDDDNIGTKKVYRLDLQSLELKEVLQMDGYTGFFRYIHPRKWYFAVLESISPTGEKPMIKSLIQVKNGNIEMLKIFEPFEYQGLGNYFGIFSTGAVIMRDGETKVYTLPGFTPINFKKLN